MKISVAGNSGIRAGAASEGLARLLQALKSNPDAGGDDEQLIEIIVKVVSLDALEEEGKDPRADDADGAEDLSWFLSVMRWAHEAGSDEWIEKLLSADAEAITRLVDKLDEEARERPASTDYPKRNAFRAIAGVLRLVQAAEEYGWVESSGPLKVMRLRRAAAAGEIPRSEVSYRALGRHVGVDGKTIKAWDKRAEELGVTLDDWDYERLRQIVNPSKRAPP